MAADAKGVETAVSLEEEVGLVLVAPAMAEDGVGTRVAAAGRWRRHGRRCDRRRCAEAVATEEVAAAAGGGGGISGVPAGTSGGSVVSRGRRGPRRRGAAAAKAAGQGVVVAATGVARRGKDG